MLEIKVKVNDAWISGTVKPDATLLAFLRKQGFTEVKRGCDEGDCGSCVILLDGKAVNSCLVLAAQADGSEVHTVRKEGDSILEEIKKAFVKYEGIQCGFCTPGMIMTARWLLSENAKPSREQIRDAVSGNLCRCTGYQKIIDAIEYVSGVVNES